MRGAIVTIDVAGAQKVIASRIIDGEGDCSAVEEYLSDMTAEPRTLLCPVEVRGHDLSVSEILEVADSGEVGPDILQVESDSLRLAQAHDRPIVLFAGGHPIKLGLSQYLVDLIDRGLISHVATNGSGLIHDFELASIGGTSENVSNWIKRGQFGLWRETSRLNDIVSEGARRGKGLGYAIGRAIEEEKMPHRDVSIAAAGYRCGVPITCHVTIGADIIHAHPNCDGAALGATSHRDFLTFAESIRKFAHEPVGDEFSRELGHTASDASKPDTNYRQQGKDSHDWIPSGVFLNIGSAVTGPEVYLKALSLARNLAHQQGQEIRRFATGVFDLVPLPENATEAEPAKDDYRYYYRPWKTILVRTVADGGRSFYVCGDHRQTIPALWHVLVNGRNGQPSSQTHPITTSADEAASRQPAASPNR